MFQSLKKTKQSKEYTQINDQETNTPPTQVYLSTSLIWKMTLDLRSKANQEITQGICILESFPGPSPAVLTNLLISDRCPRMMTRDGTYRRKA